MGDAAMAWTEKMVEDLKIMWKQGLTTGEIGKRLGVSKNSIVGKVHRLQLDARPSPIKKKDEEQENAAVAATAETKPAAVKAKTEKKTEPREEKPAAAPQPVAEKPAVVRKNIAGDVKLTDLDNHTCRWPIGDPKDENFHFCGKKVRIGQTYCEEHAALAYVKPNKKYTFKTPRLKSGSFLTNQYQFN